LHLRRCVAAGSDCSPAEALSRFGGKRFVDARAEAARAVVPQEFTMVLRGYDPAAVDALIARALWEEPRS